MLLELEIQTCFKFELPEHRTDEKQASLDKKKEESFSAHERYKNIAINEEIGVMEASLKYRINCRALNDVHKSGT